MYDQLFSHCFLLLDDDTCNIQQVQCAAGSCIKHAFRCDWEEDCTDGSDEKNCGPADQANYEAAQIYYVNTWLCFCNCDGGNVGFLHTGCPKKGYVIEFKNTLIQ